MNRLRNPLVVCLAFVVVGVFALISLNLSFLSPIAQVVKDFEMSDIYYQILQDTDDEEVNDEVVIVDMSELYSRRDLALALETIEACHPKVIGVDVVFEGLKEDSVGDRMISTVARNYDNIVFSYKLLEYENDSVGYVDSVHSFFSDEIKGCEGFTNMQRNLYGGMKRKLSMGRMSHGEVVPSFIAKVIEQYEDKKYCEPTIKDIGINYLPRKFRVVAPDSIMENESLIVDKLVLFGAMKDENDMHYTPLGKMAGVELLAYSMVTLLERSGVKDLNVFIMFVLSFLLVWLTQAVFSYYGKYAKRHSNRFWRFLLSASFVKSLLMFLWMALWMWVAFILFCKYNIKLNMGWALSAMAFLALAQSIYDECEMAFKE